MRADLPTDWSVCGAVVRTCGSTDLHTDMRNTDLRGCIRIYPVDFADLWVEIQEDNTREALNLFSVKIHRVIATFRYFP